MESDDAPSTRPIRVVRPVSSDGIVENVIPFEETGRIASALKNDASIIDKMRQSDFVEAVALKLIEKGAPGGSDGGIPPEKYAKSMKRHNWLAIVMSLLLGPGGAIAVIYATSDMAKANSKEVEHLKESSRTAIWPRIEKTEESVRLIRIQVDTIKTSVKQIKGSNADIVKGIQELKKENLNRLKDELDDARRELRRERNLNR